jgi:hypothetical protein
MITDRFPKAMVNFTHGDETWRISIRFMTGKDVF